MFTFQQLIRIYSDNVAKGVSDTDLTPKERRLTQVMLNIASNAGLAVLNYPPQDDERSKIVKRFTDLMWDSSTYALVAAISPSSETAFSNAMERTVTILNNM